MEIVNDLGRLLKENRLKKCLKINEVAEATGLSCSYISRLESGSRVNPTIDVLISFCNFYEIDFFKLIIGNTDTSAKVLDLQKELDQCESVIIYDKPINANKFKNLINNLHAFISD